MNSTHTVTQSVSVGKAISNSYSRVAKSLVAVSVIAILLAVAAQIRYPVPGSPVPATLQTLVVLCTGSLVGARLGFAAVALYLAFGFSGVAAFASGPLDWRALPGPTAGYLAGFLLVQPLVGLLSSGMRRRGFQIALKLVLAQALIFALGLGWLKIWSDASWSSVLAMGLWPFVPVDALLKTVAAFGAAWVAGGRVRAWIERE